MIKYFIKGISTALGFSKTEAKGTFILIIIVVLSFTATETYISFSKKKPLPSVDKESLEAWIKQVRSSYEYKDPPLKKKYNKYSSSAPYRKQIGKNYNKQKYTKFNNVNNKEYSKKKAPVVILDINHATQEELRKVKGIGKVLSDRLIKYRDLLGGFHNLSQLNEVYGIDNETAEEAKKFFSVQSEVTKINLNNDSLKALVRHPYLNYDLARIIMNYREQHGSFTSGKDLQNILALDEETFKKLIPYLD